MLLGLLSITPTRKNQCTSNRDLNMFISLIHHWKEILHRLHIFLYGLNSKGYLAKLWLKSHGCVYISIPQTLCWFRHSSFLKESLLTTGCVTEFVIKTFGIGLTPYLQNIFWEVRIVVVSTMCPRIDGATITRLPAMVLANISVMTSGLT